MPQSSNNPFHIGLRTFKTAVSVFICVVLFRILHRGSPMLAALSAIFSLRIDHQQTFKLHFLVVSEIQPAGPWLSSYST